MREIKYEDVVATVREMSIEANLFLKEDVKNALSDAYQREQSETGKNILGMILKNMEVAERERLPLCQDTGLAVFFVEIGEDVKVSGKGLTEAINEGMRQGYKDGYLRKSVVADPLRRTNTGDNSPAIIYYSLVPGDRLKIAFAPKGGGSENMSTVKMFPPSAGWEGIKKFVLEWVFHSGGNPCPPTILGIGIGGNFELAALNAKKALVFRKMGERNRDPFWAEKEVELLEDINKLGVGPMGLGGTVTSLDVFIEVAPCHIASLPMAINTQCHANRHAFREL